MISGKGDWTCQSQQRACSFYGITVLFYLLPAIECSGLLPRILEFWQALAAQGELNDVTTFSGIVDLFQDKYMTINLNVFNGDDDNTKYNIKEAAVADDDDVDSDAASDDEKEQNDDDDGNDVDNVDCDDNDNYSRRLSC